MSDWERMVRHHRHCVVLEAANAAPDLDIASLSMVTGSEVISSKDFMQSRIDGPAVQIARSVGRGEELSYGWPTIVFEDEHGFKAAPLWTATCLQSADEENRVVLRLEAELDFNPIFSDGSRFDPTLYQTYADTIGTVIQDPAAYRQSVVEVAASALNLPMIGFDGETLLDELGQEPGIYNVALLTKGDSFATRSLVAELQVMATRTDWASTAAGALISRTIGSIERPSSSQSVLAPLAVNRSQRSVLLAVPQQDVTVVTGPPGTGKSQVVVDLVANAWRNGESVLLVSTNNAAVDVAVQRSNDIVDGLIMRTGNRDQRDRLSSLVHEATSRSEPLDPEERADLEAAFFVASRGYEGYLDEIEALLELNRAQTDAVVQEARLRERLGLTNTEIPPIEELRLLRHQANSLVKARFFRTFRIKRFLRRIPGGIDASAFSTVQRWLEVMRTIEERYEAIRKMTTIVGPESDRVDELQGHWAKTSLDLTRAIVRDQINRNQSAFQDIGGANVGGTRLARAIERSLPGLRGWACTSLSLAANFPLEAGFFDVLIVDEASQCLLSHILPAAYRAKRIVVVGDPMQLPPIARITNKQELEVLRSLSIDADLAERQYLRVRPSIGSEAFSTYDAYRELVGPENTFLLNEHYRCHPRIARWFNQTFYASSLQVLTDLHTNSPGQRGIAWIDVDGEATRPGSKSWTNAAEARACIELVELAINDGRSVGVIAPFRAQADAVRDDIYAWLDDAELGPEVVADFDFRAGTAHAFQGDERDVIIFSPCVAPGMSEPSARWLETQRKLLNVAVSRAREMLYIVGSPHIGSFPCPTLMSLRSFVQSGAEGSAQPIAAQLASESEARLYEALVSMGFAPLSKANHEGYELDFAIYKDGRRFDIEVDGDQHRGPEGGLRIHDLTRDRVIRATGWEVIRVPAWLCFTKPESAALLVVAAMNIQNEAT